MHDILSCDSVNENNIMMCIILTVLTSDMLFLSLIKNKMSFGCLLSLTSCSRSSSCHHMNTHMHLHSMTSSDHNNIMHMHLHSMTSSDHNNIIWVRGQWYVCYGSGLSIIIIICECVQYTVMFQIILLRGFQMENQGNTEKHKLSSWQQTII